MSKERAFTIIELMVVMVVMSVISLSMYVVFNQTVKSWKKTEARLDIYQNARIVFDQLSRELRSSYVVTGDDNIYFRIDDDGGENGSDILYFPFYCSTEETGKSYQCMAKYYLVSGNNGYNLNRKIYRVDSPSQDIDSVAGGASALILNVRDFQVEVWNGVSGSWTESGWDSRSSGANPGEHPEAVNIVITVQEDIPSAPEIKEFNQSVTLNR